MKFLIERLVATIVGVVLTALITYASLIAIFGPEALDRLFR